TRFAFGFAERVPYRVAPIFLIRLAGTPFETVERLATSQTNRAARDVINLAGTPGVDEAEARLATSLAQELEATRTLLLASARKILPAYLIFAAEGIRHRVSSLFENDSATKARPENRNASVRKREQHFLLYLQRIAAKDDTFGEFGPISWGKLSDATRGLQMRVEQGIAARDVFLERWTAHAVV